MRALLSLAIVCVATLPALSDEVPAASQPSATPQPSVGERVGESVERGLTKLGEKVRKTWADFRRSVDELSVQGRVYGRLHWDKAIGSAPIEISVKDENVVTLSGSVPNEAARQAAVKLANDTIGVRQVVDHLTIGATNTTTTTTTTTITPATPPLEAPKR